MRGKLSPLKFPYDSKKSLTVKDPESINFML